MPACQVTADPPSGSVANGQVKSRVQHTERSGLLLAIAGFAILSVGDAVVKTMAGAWPVTLVAALRFSIGAIALAGLLWAKQGAAAFRPRNPWIQLGRGVCLSISTLAFFSAIYVMPLAETMAITFVSPVLTAVLSGPLLGERVRPAVWIASAFALAGVFVILRPNFLELGWAAIFPLVAALFFSLVIILNRASAGQGSALSMQFFMAAVAAPILVVAAFGAKWVGIAGMDFGWPSLDMVLRCTFVALTASTAHYLTYLGTTRAGAAQVAPASYVQILVASFFGWWWFDNTPDLLTMLGAAVVIGAGLYLWRDGLKLAQPNITV